MSHTFVRVSVLTVVTIVSLFRSCQFKRVDNDFLDLHFSSSDKTLFLNLAQRLTLTENVLKRTLSLVTASKNIPFSDIQDLLQADQAVSTYLSDFSDTILPHDANESAEPSLSKSKWKRELSISSLIEERLKAALQSTKKTSLEDDPPQVSSRSSPSAVPTFAPSIDTPGNVKEPSAMTVPALQTGNITARNGTSLKGEDQVVTQKNLKEAVSILQNVVKCSMAQPSEAHEKDRLGVFTEFDSTMVGHGKLNIQFQMKTCLKYWTGVWLNVSEKASASSTVIAVEPSFFRVPKDCLRKRGHQYFLDIPSNMSSKCSFQLPPLQECKVYQVEARAMFLELLGAPVFQDVNVLPLAMNEKTSIRVLYAEASSNFLEALWSISSTDCAELLSYVNVKISEDGLYADETATSYSYTIPRYCMRNDGEVFEAHLGLKNASASEIPCPHYSWKPLDNCRKYRLEMTPEYPSAYIGNVSSVEIFTASDTESSCCNLLTEETGSIFWNGNSRRTCSWLISAKKGQQIWFTPSNPGPSCSYGQMMIFDGSYETSPQLLQFCDRGTTTSVRSRSNKLYVKLVPNNDYNHYYEEINVLYGLYATVNAMATPYTSGCGGYIVDAGHISKPSYPSSEFSSSVCFFYIRSSDSTATLAITSDSGKVEFPMEVYADWSGHDKREIPHYNFTGSGGNGSDELGKKLVTYSPGDKMLIVFPKWNTAEREKYLLWNIHKLNAGCRFNLTSDSGTIESPNYPNAYKKRDDCRWMINTQPNSRIRFTLATLELVEEYDYLTIYDGLEIRKSIFLKEITGTISKPITLISSKNELLVRLTTVDRERKSMRRPGFFAVYAAVG